MTAEAIEEKLPLNLGCSERLRGQLYLPATTPSTPSEKHSSLEAQQTRHTGEKPLKPEGAADDALGL
jgi:hypothetical protein